MDYDNFCRRCEHYDFHIQQGILCGLTAEKPAFEITCDDFEPDPDRNESESEPHVQPSERFSN